MDIQTKERFTGAVILVALVVLLVPELLSGPSHAKPSSGLPKAGEPPLRSYTFEVAEDARSHAPKPLVEEKPPEANLEAQRVEEPTAVTQEAKPVPQERTAAKEAQEATEVQEVKEVKAPPKVVEQPKPAKEPPPVTGWSIQVGSFASLENAQRFVKQLKAKGYTAFVAGGGGGKGHLYRVRVGPEPDRAAAAALAAKLRAGGFPGSIVPHP